MHIYRKVTEDDLFGKSTNTVKIKSCSNLKIKKHQKDYGEKKYIKP
tara:strand:+ start:52 stop:189 length:138 start_codon:yes stop_codon:yes gene_type:complete